ncbi:unnamed protein product [Spirodela intermedia]|uniref:Uncharacterized protein n=1 Tax=Spirodela intermedia TaxID=51605 RepID=A0ABN7E7N9_SPIIN|nr:unnamed protein product [Spirodela intermedia]
MPTSRITIGRREEATHPDALRAAAAEFFSTLIFVFAGQGSGVAFSDRQRCDDSGGTGGGGPRSRLRPVRRRRPRANISGGHVNPAVTFGIFLGGNITLFRGLLYWVAQLLGSIVACLLLLFVTGSVTVGVGVWNAVVLEIVLTFGLVYTVYATAVDPKKDSVANILVGGAFDGAAMNPAIAFGPALVSWSWTNHWVYWLVPSSAAALLGSFTSSSSSSIPTRSSPPPTTTETPLYLSSLLYTCCNNPRHFSLSLSLSLSPSLSPLPLSPQDPFRAWFIWLLFSIDLLKLALDGYFYRRFKENGSR